MVCVCVMKMYIHTCVYMQIGQLISYFIICFHVQMHEVCVCVCVVYACMCVCTHACVYIYACVYICACMYGHLYMCISNVTE